MRSEFLCVFPAERKRVGWIDAACDYADERFILTRLRPQHLFKLQHVRRAILMRDDCFHHRFFVGARAVREKQNRDTQNDEAGLTHLHKLSCIEHGSTTG